MELWTCVGGDAGGVLGSGFAMLWLSDRLLCPSLDFATRLDFVLPSSSGAIVEDSIGFGLQRDDDLSTLRLASSLVPDAAGLVIKSIVSKINK